MKYFIVLFCLLLSSCAGLVSRSQDVPIYISQVGEEFYLHLIFDHVPNYTFLIDEVQINQDDIKYQKISDGHLIQVPVNETQLDFKVNSALNTLIHRKIRLKKQPQKLMVLAAVSRPLISAIKKEDPDVLILFAPPVTPYYSSNDFFKNQIFYQHELRLLHIVGHENFTSALTFKDFAILDFENIEKVDRPTLLTHYLPFTLPREDFSFNQLADQLKMKELPIIFISSYGQNLIQQIPKSQIGVPTYEFSVKNHFLNFNQDSSSPWEMILDQRSDYFTLEVRFTQFYWHVHLLGKDDQLRYVFERDLTLYQKKPDDGRHRRRAR